MNRSISVAASFTLYVAILSFTVAFFRSAPAQAETDLVELTLRVTGIERPSGALAIAIFDGPDGYEDFAAPVARAFVPATGDSVSWSAMLPAEGHYAAVVYHDVNGNGSLDRGRFGIPEEPYGFSNNARAPFGPPRFDAASFAAGSEPFSISIELR